jgi:signal transduction histidine kinase/ActR/RegA family two-component response regulator
MAYPALWRTLESWTTQQDYFWFLAVLAWGAVAAAAWLRGKERSHGWLVGWAVANIASAGVEIHLLASDVNGPYVAWDRAMLGAQCVATACLLWGGLTVRHALRAAVVGGGMVALALVRNRWPVAGGFALALVQAGAALLLLRQIRQDRVFGISDRMVRLAAETGTLIILFWPLLATHGPLAHWLGMGRINQDFSRFALVASSCLMLAGIAWSVALWRERLLEALGANTPDREIQLKFHRSVLWLGGWLVLGLALIVWNGRVARRSFETSLIARVNTAVQLLDPAVAARALGPALAPGGWRERRVDNPVTGGQTVEQISLPLTTESDFQRLRSQLARIADSNRDITFIFLTAIRDGRVLLTATAADSSPDNPWHWVLGPATGEDRDRLARREAFLEGPYRTPWGPFFVAKAPILNPAGGPALGWLEFRIASTHWLASFTQARLQGLALVAVGVGLWALAVAYELRRATGESAARRAAAAAEADRLKSAFLASVSHELRTPIQSVLGYGELLAGEDLPGAAPRWVSALRTHGQIMLQLVNDLLDHGALQSGSFQLHPRVVELRRLVEECVTAVRPQSAAKGLAVRWEFAEPLPDQVRVDPVRLRQVLLNLLANGVKFTARGEVRLQVRRAPDAVPSASAVPIEFLVSDTGPGIPAAKRAELFKPFSRLDAAETEGTGLGLALVAGLCTSMGGSVRLLDDSAVAGASFLVTLPLETNDTGTVASLSGAVVSQAWSGIRMLVAEDNPLVRELLVTFLEKQGAAVTAVADGVAALAASEAQDYQVVLLDWMMPAPDGLATARALRTRGKTPVPFIVGLSAHARSDGFARALEAGMDAFVAKPVDLAALAEVIGMAPGMPPLPVKVQPTDAVLIAKLQARFSAELPGLVQAITAAAHAADRPRAHERAHYLKNSADFVGARVLGLACQALCTQADSAPAEDLNALAAAITVAARAPFGPVSR